MSKKPVVLMILDGYGLIITATIMLCVKRELRYGPADEPVSLRKRQCQRPGSRPAGRQMGNSEVGHLNMGAGRIVYQELTRIYKSDFRRRLLYRFRIFTGSGKLQKEQFRTSYVGTGFRRWCSQPHRPYLWIIGTCQEKRP